MVSNTEELLNFVKNDNTNKTKYVILFFVFMIALSQNLFKNLFGCNLQKIIKNNYTKHVISLLFLFLLVDINIDTNIEYKSNPLISLVFSFLKL